MPSQSAMRLPPSVAAATVSRSRTPNCATPSVLPLMETVDDFFAREVQPHVPNAWIDESKRDPKDGQVGVVGYEINFNRHFYRYTPPRPLEDIERDIQVIEADIMRMLGEVTGAAK